MLENIITKDKVISYTRGVVDVAEKLYELNDDYSRLLIPSRGAYPIYSNAVKAINNSKIDLNIDYDVILLPFSSDSFEEGRAEEVRDYWVEVYDSMLKGTNPIMVDFYKFILSDVCNEGYDKLAKLLRYADNDFACDYDLHAEKDTNTNCVFIDTVLSGRASHTILKSMQKRDIDFHAILIVDRNGQRLKNPYKQYLKELEAQQKVTLIGIDDIFTEDSSPTLLGMNTIVFPSLIKAGADISEIADTLCGHPGAGVTLRIPHQQNKYASLEELKKDYILTQIMNNSTFFDEVLASGVKLEMKKRGWSGGSKKRLKDRLETSIDSFHDWGKDSNFLSKQKTKELYMPLVKRLPLRDDYNLEVTSSHIISVDFSASDTKRLIEKFKDKVIRGKKA